MKKIFLPIAAITILAVGCTIKAPPVAQQGTQESEAVEYEIIADNRMPECSPSVSLSGGLKSNADLLVTNKVGEEFFSKHIQYVCSTETEVLGKTGYQAIYVVKAWNDPVIILPIHVTIGKSGEPLDSAYVPNCLKTEEGCEIKISPQQAVESAKFYRLERGTGNWTVRFDTRGENFVWVITAYFDPTKNNGKQSESMYISTSTGLIIGTSTYPLFLPGE